jgi:hypothetical protein
MSGGQLALRNYLIIVGKLQVFLFLSFIMLMYTLK